MMIIALIVSMLAYGIIASILYGYGTTINLDEIVRILESFGLQSLYLFCITSVCVFISCIVRSEALTVVFTYLITGFDALILYFMNQFLKVDLSAFSLEEILQDINELSISPTLFLHFTVVFIVLGVLLSMLGNFIYKKKSF